MKQIERLEDALGKIDDDLLFDAETVRGRKPRHHFAFFAAAACLTVMLLAIPLGILIANQNETPKVPLITTSNTIITTATLPTTTIPPQTTKRPSILDLPGATVFDENDERFAKLGAAVGLFSTVSQSSTQKKEWCDEVKQNYSMVIGKLVDHTSALVQDRDGYYRISTLEIEVSRVSRNIESVIQDKIVTVVYVCRYDCGTDPSHYKPSTVFYAGKATNFYTDTIIDYNVSVDMLNNTLYWQEATPKVYGSTYDSLFFINSAEGKTVTIENETYELSDYADYVMEASFGFDNSALQLLFMKNHAIPFPFSYIEDVFPPTEPELPKPIPSYDRDALDMLNAPDPYKIITQNQDGSYFAIEKKNIVIHMVSESDFFDDLFIDKREPNPDYAWAVVIDGTVYDVESPSLKTTSSETLVHLDLGEDFNADTPFDQIILGIYNKYATPYSFDYFANLTQKN